MNGISFLEELIFSCIISYQSFILLSLLLFTIKSYILPISRYNDWNMKNTSFNLLPVLLFEIVH